MMSSNDSPLQNPGAPAQEDAAMEQPSLQSESSETAASVAEALRLPGVEGAGVGQDAQGNAVLKVYLRSESARTALPASLGGLPIEAEVTGEIRAQTQDK